MMLQPHESELVGQWELKNGQAVADTTTRRIKWLTENSLVELGSDSTGWDVLYVDRRDGRLWELTYLQSDSHGGGPPRLALLDPKRAQEKYGRIAIDP
jgi:Immunity protein 27